MTDPPPRIRLAELVALLSLGTDLGLGQPMEHIMRQCTIALRFAERLGLDESERVIVYYSGLLAWVGCHTDAYEQAKWFGDDIALKAGAMVGGDNPLPFLSRIGAGKPLFERARIAIAFLGDGRRDAMGMLLTHYLATDALAAQLGLSAEMRTALGQNYERWDGKGPMGRKGADICISSRLVNLADVAEVFHRSGGVEAATAMARKRSGGQFDPELVQLFCAEAETLLANLDSASGWDAVIAAEPALGIMLTDDEFEHALAAIGDFADLKSPWTIGHSRGVAELAAEAAQNYGLAASEVASVRRAGYVHDLGRLGVSNAIWDKRGALTQSERERLRLHPYLTERMLASPVLAPLGAIAGQHHERLDGSGYPRGLSGDGITPAGRILAAADAYHTKTELRPHRPARTAADSAAELRDMVAAGQIDGDAADAVLRAAGHPVSGRRDLPSGLTAREVEVLKLLALGFSNKEIAQQLTISAKTAGSHIEHIYDKIGASNRARASLFAMQHGLMASNGPLQTNLATRGPQRSGECPMWASH